MSEQISMAEALRQGVAADLRPVKPLRAPWIRVLWAVPIALVMTIAMLWYFGLRTDLEGTSPLLSWVPVILQCALGVAVLSLALHEVVPGMRVATPVVFAVSLSALAIHLAANTLLWVRDPSTYEGFLATFWPCFRMEMILGVPFLAVITYLSAKALPIRPPVIGALAGIGGGFIADASWRLVCPVTAPAHFLTAHLGGVALLGLSGFLLGLAFEAYRTRSRLLSVD